MAVIRKTTAVGGVEDKKAEVVVATTKAIKISQKTVVREIPISREAVAAAERDTAEAVVAAKNAAKITSLLRF